MKKKFILAIFFGALSLVLSGCKSEKVTIPTVNSNTSVAKTVEITEDLDGGDESKMGADEREKMEAAEKKYAMQKEEQMEKKENPGTKAAYMGAVLTGSVSPVLDFSQKDYDTALAAKKNIVLYFYASWCPLCKEEIPKLYAAFDSLKDPNLIAFRVNFKDSDTDANEEVLAKQFGVPYQHTKVFLKNGVRILKSPESWDTARYLKEIAAAFNS
jgi:thiol-disulfide isomerase/thioredoxin